MPNHTTSNHTPSNQTLSNQTPLAKKQATGTTGAMAARPSQILVFKTNIHIPAMGIFVRPVLDATEGIVQWTIDYTDCDHVLRVVTTGPDARDIEAIICQTGFTCEELAD